jgi:parallel beta-helix repeat protein
LGSGIYCGNRTTIENCRIENNASGVLCTHRTKISDCTISDSYKDRGIICFEGKPTIEYCTISGNIGGGINLGRSSGIIRNCVITGNREPMNGIGAGISCGIRGRASISNCLIAGNFAERGGGGVFFNLSEGLTMSNCTIVGNGAGSCGGGIWVVSGWDVTVKDCILWGNSAEIGNQIALEHPDWSGESIVAVSYSDVGGGEDDIYVGTGCTIDWGLGNIDLDPCFVDPNASDHHLSEDSPCIDAGDPNYVAEPNETDLDGNPRVFGDRIDMGAYEFFNTPPVACIVGGDQTVEVGSGCEAKVTLDGSCSSDADSTPGTNDDINDFDWYEVIDVCDPNSDIFLGSGEIIECNLPLGEHTIILEVIDKADAFDANEVIITVEDTTPPEFSLTVTPGVLWPPNHKMVLITPSWEVSDNCDELPEVTLVSITMNEDDDAKGDGHTSDDIRVKPDGSIYLRAERSGKGTGRIYTITYRAVDDSGNVTVQSAAVTVPHNRIPTWFRRIPRDRLRHMLLRRLRSRVRRYRQRSAPVMTVSTAPRRAPRR